MSRYKLSNGKIVPGHKYVLVGDVQYILDRLSPAERAALGVEDYVTPASAAPVDGRFYYGRDEQGNPLPRPIESIRKTLKAEVASDRWQAEQAGMFVNLNDKPTFFATDQKTRNVLTAAFALAKAEPMFSIQTFRVPAHSIEMEVDSTDLEGNPIKVIERTEVSEAYISLSNADVQQVALTVAVFVQSLYDKNKEIDAQIDALETVKEAEVFSWSFAK